MRNVRTSLPKRRRPGSGVEPPGRLFVSLWRCDGSCRPHHGAPPPGSYLANGVLSVYGTNKSDTIIVYQDATAGTISATVNGVNTLVSSAGVSEIKVFPLKGNDLVNGSGVWTKPPL